jgi:uncharacterized protein (DUF2236 family)
MRSMFPVIHLPPGLQRKIGPAVRAFLYRAEGGDIDFGRPQGEEALVHPNSVSWRVFKNPVALYVGGIAAVILELAEPAVRSGIWEHSSFRRDPTGRLRRTGLAAIVTVYGPRSIAEPMIARVVRMHAKVVGQTPAGVPYAANDAQLLTWVHATAGFGFAEAYRRYVRPLSAWESDAAGSVRFDARPPRALSDRVRIPADHARHAVFSRAAASDATLVGAGGSGSDPRLDS